MIKNVILILIAVLLFCNRGISQNIANGLVAHWSFDNDSVQIIKDISGNGINGTSNEIDYVTGIKGKAILFNSPQDAVFFPAKNQPVPERIANLSIGSISVWFNFQNIDGNILPVLYFGESSENEAHNSLIIEIGHGPDEGDPQNRRLYFTIVNQRFCYDSKANLSPDSWYHFVAVVGATGNTGYLNGVELTKRNYNLGSNSTYHDFFADVPAKEILSLGYGRFGQNNRFFPFKENCKNRYPIKLVG